MTIKPLYPSSDPTLDLNFAGARALDPRVTFTRSSVATRVGPDGLLQTVAPNVARFDHSPTTRESLGLLVEEPRTNLLQRSEEFENAGVWPKSQSSVSSNTATSPVGTLTADSLVENTASGFQHYATQTVTISANTVYTATVYVKANTRSSVRFGFLNSALSSGAFAHFNVSTGVISTQTTAGTASNVSFSIEAAASGWYRCRTTCTVDSSSTLGSVFIGLVDGTNNATYTGDGTSGIYLWGAQLEAGAFPTSYIRNVDTPGGVTRTADIASITGTAFSSWYRQDAQTWFGDFSPIYTASATIPANTPHLMQVYTAASFINNYALRGTEANIIQLAIARNPTSGAQFPGVTLGFALAGQSRRLAYAINSSELQLASMGVLGSSLANNAAALMTTHDVLSIGSGTGGAPPSQLNGHIRRLTYWPRRLPNAMLQAITS